MKNEINTGQFHGKTGFLGNGRKNLISTPVNTKIRSHKYKNRQTKIENETDRNGNISIRFQPYMCGTGTQPPEAVALLSGRAGRFESGGGRFGNWANATGESPGA